MGEEMIKEKKASGNIMDYLEWRGDLSFEKSPFNEVDNLIVSYLSYVNLDGIAPGPGEGQMTIREASERFFDTYTQEELDKDKSFIRLVPYMMRTMAETERFGQAVMRNYVNKIEEKTVLQFCALELELGDGTSYVSFRGTDDTIVGWKEDFLLCNGVVPAEQEAANYLNMVGKNSAGKLRVGGHSKGGNLAIYAAADCQAEVQDKIIEVYNNDGPGFEKEFLSTPALEKIRPRIKRFLPESSVIGMLLEHMAEPVILQSSQKGILQHDGLSWQVLGPSFVTCDERSRMSKVFDKTLRGWIDGLEPKQREDFIDDLFAVLEAPGVLTLTELQDGGMKNVRAMLKRMEELTPESREIVEKLLKGFLNSWTEMVGKREK